MEETTVDDGLFRSGVVPLVEYGLLKVHGTDAASFLQNQLTNDVASLADGEVRLAGYCSVKGRLLASFWLWREADAQTFWLACSRDIAATTAKRLSMFVMRAKAKVEDVSDAFALLGRFKLDGAADGLPAPEGGAFALRLPGVVVSGRLAAALNPALLETAGDVAIERTLHLVAASAVEPTLQQLQAAGARLLSTHAWRRLEVLSGIARISASSQDLFVPQMVNFELVGGVSFRKGCYPGQEVVARSQYLGKLKRRMFLGLSAGEPPLPGTDVTVPAAVPDAPGVLAESAEPVGKVVLAASLVPGTGAARFVVLFEAVSSAVGEADDPQSSALQIGESRVTRLPLPYPIPQQAPKSTPPSRDLVGATPDDAA